MFVFIHVWNLSFHFFFAGLEIASSFVDVKILSFGSADWLDSGLNSWRSFQWSFTLQVACCCWRFRLDLNGSARFACRRWRFQVNWRSHGKRWVVFNVQQSEEITATLGFASVGDGITELFNMTRENFTARAGYIEWNLQVIAVMLRSHCAGKPEKL